MQQYQLVQAPVVAKVEVQAPALAHHIPRPCPQAHNVLAMRSHGRRVCRGPCRRRHLLCKCLARYTAVWACAWRVLVVSVRILVAGSAQLEFLDGHTVADEVVGPAHCARSTSLGGALCSLHFFPPSPPYLFSWGLYWQGSEERTLDPQTCYSFTTISEATSRFPIIAELIFGRVRLASEEFFGIYSFAPEG